MLLRNSLLACKRKSSFNVQALAGVRLLSSSLDYKKLPFNSVEIMVPREDFGLQAFESSLQSFLEYAQTKKYSAAYLSVPMNRSSLIEPAGKLGFQYHHAENDLAKLYIWLADFENRVPTFATHSCGVGGLVLLKGTSKMLAIKENPPNNKNWKIPGGYCNLGEDFCQAAIREVREETGVESTFKSVLAFRHSHQQQFGRSNIYVICLLEARDRDITVDAEIEAAQWMEIDAFKKCSTHPMSTLIADLVLSHKQKHEKQPEEKTLGLREQELSSKLSGPLPYKFYYV